jgi:hypothetical protein
VADVFPVPDGKVLPGVKESPGVVVGQRDGGHGVTVPRGMLRDGGDGGTRSVAWPVWAKVKAGTARDMVMRAGRARPA